MGTFKSKLLFLALLNALFLAKIYVSFFEELFFALFCALFLAMLLFLLFFYTFLCTFFGHVNFFFYFFYTFLCTFKGKLFFLALLNALFLGQIFVDPFWVTILCTFLELFSPCYNMYLRKKSEFVLVQTWDFVLTGLTYDVSSTLFRMLQVLMILQRLMTLHYAAIPIKSCIREI